MMRSMSGSGTESAERLARLAARVVVTSLLTVGLLVLVPAAGHPGTDHPLLATALTALAAVITIAAAAGQVVPVAVPVAVGASARAAATRARRSGSPRQAHPDAAGHVRGRAPGRRPGAR